MKIRRYLGSNTQEAILKVKMDLGNDAVILNTRKVRQKGFLKIFAKPMIEVLAAVDDDYGTKKEAQRQNISQQAAVKEPPKEIPAVKTDGKDEKISELETKVNSMEMLLHKIYDQLQPASAQPVLPQPVEQRAAEQKAEASPQEKQSTYPKVFELFYNNLIKNEVEIETAKRIIGLVMEKIGQNASVNDVASVLNNVISGILGKPETVRMREDGKPTVVMMVGPTGVGKTTTLAKIAANYALNHKKKVGMITADTYRIAAVEQLKTYAEILGMPVTVIYSPSELSEAINQHSDKDVILIDTAGRSHKNKAQFEELKTLISAANADEIYLLLSATTSPRNCKEIISNYNFLKDYKLLFTKLDETQITGIILNARFMTNKSLSYITTGQSVPDDIEIMNVDKITKNLLGSIT
ncbi:MAG: flagellar biosynthesis protein FlhF [Clostridia bacterium]|nr:flagellar biosynthesis protein FlhF [Clostridia bacterium]